MNPSHPAITQHIVLMWYHACGKITSKHWRTYFELSRSKCYSYYHGFVRIVCEKTGPICMWWGKITQQQVDKSCMEVLNAAKTITCLNVFLDQVYINESVTKRMGVMTKFWFCIVGLSGRKYWPSDKNWVTSKYYKSSRICLILYSLMISINKIMPNLDILGSIYEGFFNLIPQKMHL